MGFQRTYAMGAAAVVTVLLAFAAYRFSPSTPVASEPLRVPSLKLFSHTRPSPLLPKSELAARAILDRQPSPEVTPDKISPSMDWRWEPYYRSQVAEPSPAFNLKYSSVYQRNENTGVASISPMTLNLSQPLDIGTWQTFRPTVSAGVGVLSQSLERREYQDSQNEVRALLHLGIGAEWTPTDWLLFRLGYDYFQLPVSSSLNPDYPESDHAVTLGLEIKF